jgi:hypothetical protein
MNPRKSFAAALVAWAPMLALLSIGCRGSSSSSSVDPKGEAIHIMQAAGHIGKYITANKNQAPKDTSEMKDWAAKNNIPEDELQSTRDHEPYEVHEVAKGTMKELIVTEKTGAKGRKFMWRTYSPSKIGMEQDQNEIDAALKSEGGIPGRPANR